ncbi:MAG: beta-1,4-galactosyltransferase [Planctomycetes bacterium]|nr:beta-1,4-galactosyltransferase [Planctomycetota bacterium]
MIFVTVGSALAPFDRLFKAVDEMAPRLGEPVIMQVGFAGFKAANVECLGYVTFGRIQSLVRECRVLIGHGSTGPVLMARRYGKPVIMVPRLPEFGETADAHPLEAAQFVEKKGSRMTEVVYDIADLEPAVRRAQAKADAGLTYEPDPKRERLLQAVRAAVEGREISAP